MLHGDFFFLTSIVTGNVPENISVDNDMLTVICLGCRDGAKGESTRLPPMWPRFDSQIRHHMWVEFVCSIVCTGRFSPSTPVSPLLKKPPFDLI